MPRGSETAKLVYGAESGWVTHDEMNLFGHTGCENCPSGSRSLNPANGTQYKELVHLCIISGRRSLDEYVNVPISFP